MLIVWFEKLFMFAISLNVNMSTPLKTIIKVKSGKYVNRYEKEKNIFQKNIIKINYANNVD